MIVKHGNRYLVLDHEPGRALGDPRGDFNLAVVRGQLHRRHLADIHVLEADKTLAGLYALRGLEHDGDGRTFALDALECNSDRQRLQQGSG